MAPSHSHSTPGDKPDEEMPDVYQQDKPKSKGKAPETNAPKSNLDSTTPSPPDPSTISVNGHDHSQDYESDSEDVTKAEQFIIDEINKEDIRIFNAVPILTSLKRKGSFLSHCEMGDDCVGDSWISYDKGDGICGKCRKLMRQETDRLLNKRRRRIEYQAQMHQSFVGRIRTSTHQTNRVLQDSVAIAQEDVNELHQARAAMRYTERDLLNVFNQSTQVARTIGIVQREALPAPPNAPSTSNSPSKPAPRQ